jgi:hypothetical protein
MRAAQIKSFNGATALEPIHHSSSLEIEGEIDGEEAPGDDVVGAGPLKLEAILSGQVAELYSQGRALAGELEPVAGADIE